MNQKIYMKITGAIFFVVAALHLYRVTSGFPFIIGDFSVPVAISWIGILVAGLLAYIGLRS